jgi:hypothetical protein
VGKEPSPSMVHEQPDLVDDVAAPAPAAPVAFASPAAPVGLVLPAAPVVVAAQAAQPAMHWDSFVNVELRWQVEFEVAGSRQLEQMGSASHVVPSAQHWAWMQAAHAGRGSVTPPQVVGRGVPPQFTLCVHSVEHAPH